MLKVLNEFIVNALRYFFIMSHKARENLKWARLLNQDNQWDGSKSIEQSEAKNEKKSRKELEMDFPAKLMKLFSLEPSFSQAISFSTLILDKNLLFP